MLLSTIRTPSERKLDGGISFGVREIGRAQAAGFYNRIQVRAWRSDVRLCVWVGGGPRTSGLIILHLAMRRFAGAIDRGGTVSANASILVADSICDSGETFSQRRQIDPK